VKIKITIEQKIPLYQKLAPKIRELKALGMTSLEIAIQLEISKKTVKKGLGY
jgi:orotate phosphoribosyltransferase-like protein